MSKIKKELIPVSQLHQYLPLTKENFYRFPADFRIAAIASDGMWYSVSKWKKLAKVTAEELQSWIDKAVSEGDIVQATAGARSYFMPYQSMYQWYKKHGLTLGCQLLDWVYPARVWDGMNENEGFLLAPVRNLSTTTLVGSTKAGQVLKQALQGVARVREESPGVYKAYSLSHTYAITKVLAAFEECGIQLGADYDKLYGRAGSKKREVCDFSKDFLAGLVSFYTDFAKSRLRGHMDTIKIFLPDVFEQNSQVLVWVLTALEKFDESSSVPFSGYFDVVLKRWPYDLPSEFLGKDVALFQQARAKALKSLKDRHPNVAEFNTIDVIKEMGVSEETFRELDSRYRVWVKTQGVASFTWGDNATDEKVAEYNLFTKYDPPVNRDLELAHKMSLALLLAGIDTSCYEDTYACIEQMDNDTINQDVISSLSNEFVVSFAQNLKTCQ